jgi:hypothetical protein
MSFCLVAEVLQPGVSASDLCCVTANWAVIFAVSNGNSNFIKDSNFFTKSFITFPFLKVTSPDEKLEQ